MKKKWQTNIIAKWIVLLEPSGPPTTPRNAAGYRQSTISFTGANDIICASCTWERPASSQWVATVSTRPATESSRGGSLCDFDWRCPNCVYGGSTEPDAERTTWCPDCAGEARMYREDDLELLLEVPTVSCLTKEWD